MASCLFFLSMASFGLLTIALGYERMWRAWLVRLAFGFRFLARVVSGPQEEPT